jgi:hypothetical protein
MSNVKRKFRDKTTSAMTQKEPSDCYKSPSLRGASATKRRKRLSGNVAITGLLRSARNDNSHKHKFCNSLPSPVCLNDVILFAGLIVIGVLLFVVFVLSKSDGANADVYVDGKLAASYSLNSDANVNLNFSGYNRLEIKDGRASVTDANCPDKLCVHQKSISKDGETIICLPHKTVIKISGGDKSDIDGAVG